MLERLSVPRRPFDFEDYVDILRRNFRWLIAPAFAGLVVSTVVAFLLPDTYVSVALIRIVPQQISPELVRNVNSQEIVDHINGMAQSILSRNTLTSLINTHGLYKWKHEPLEDIINEMRSPDVIGIRPLMGVTNISGRTLPAMQVSFSYRDSHVAKAVCDDLVSRFMSQNNQDTMENNVATNQFMNDEFERAKQNLEQIEKKLTDFQTRNAGHLPEELQTNLAEMNSLSQQLSSLRDAASRNSEQRMMLESNLHIVKDRMNAIAIVSPAQGQAAQNAKLNELDKKIDDLESAITSMKDRYTDNYPDLQAAKDELALLKRQRDEAAKEKPSKPADTTAESPAAIRERLDAQAQIDQIQTALKANDLEAQRFKDEIQATNAALRAFQGRVDNVTPHQSEYADLLRDQALAKQHYEEMEEKREKSVLSMNLEQRKQGEMLEVLDQASLPTEPAAPKRGKIIPIGAFAGLGLGIVLVAVREVKDTSLKNLKDARLYTQLSVLGSIPLLENDLVVQRRKQVMWVGWATATLVGLAIMGFSVAHYYLNKA
jgi:polysaccharide chain length determinant protein (PEP-CTERM system associated)